ncbi:hypothetical protein N825_32985 [Skermanella stibiiresistens SB22]|uniref:Uncharacterized protein n=1 Tax=Skermanella stibiiresistens SB22 TaxID=1385369 RepID=W9H3I0_9PROT|nr:hypothetical protein N825_32985 [Skermanella stibiiresistens SB22]
MFVPAPGWVPVAKFLVWRGAGWAGLADGGNHTVVSGG